MCGHGKEKLFSMAFEILGLGFSFFKPEWPFYFFTQ